MDEIYVTYVDDERVDNHDYYDYTDDDIRDRACADGVRRPLAVRPPTLLPNYLLPLVLRTH